MCLAPQRRALFRHLSTSKSGPHGVCWLGNVLCATTACTFSTSQLPKVVRSCCVLYILTSKCASRQNSVHFFDISTSKSGLNVRCFSFFTYKCASRRNGVHFFDILFPCVLYILTSTCASGHNGAQLFISYLASWLRTRRCRLAFDPPEPQIIGKTQCLWSSFFFLLSPLLSSPLLSSLLFSSLLWLFPSLLFMCPYCRKFDF